VIILPATGKVSWLVFLFLEQEIIKMDSLQHQTKQGIVIRKSPGKFEVLFEERRFSCILSPHLSPQIRPCRQEKDSFQALVTVTVGDIVSFIERENQTGVICAIQPRQNQFSRRAASAKDFGYETEQVIAANIDLAIPVVAAASPAPTWNMLDRYLVIAEANELAAVICINKIDLVDEHDKELAPVIEEYRQIGYPALLVSAKTNRGLEDLKQILQGKRSIFMGKSGVGKTSLLNAIQPGLGKRVNEVSRGSLQRGKHTTTCMEMISLDIGGFIVDTPGMRELGLWDIDESLLAEYFPEMRPLIGGCRFGLGCRHDEEPGCMIRKAVMEGRISPRRYKSYLRMKDSS
jgi:ribosome biogenesis GTPase